MAQIGSLDEARAYPAHPVLGPRYHECVVALQDITGTTAKCVFGTTDAMKLRSSLTVFAEASGAPLFHAAIERWFGKLLVHTALVWGDLSLMPSSSRTGS